MSAEVYTDGACFHNGTPQAAAGIGVFWSEGSIWNVSAPVEGDRHSNQVAELQAIKRAMQDAISQGKFSLLIHTDSKYAINCLTNWIHKWESNGFKNLYGRTVANKSLIQATVAVMRSRGLKAKFKHVQAHSGIHGNVEADRLANAGASGVLASRGWNH
eukprot:TRINITY_DN1515_c0_g1_i2.p1 TRINITY_DN1515_c0_g1~~TRINITY_DN1515_c0_g1_i2.p1  ORF type:complete len:159 (+),score=44.33 TRINITY_DN1515_c0_g1_i2:45-521(+)